MVFKNSIRLKNLFAGSLVSFLLIPGIAISQNCNQYNWPEDRKKAEEKIALYSDHKNQGNFRESANHLHWLLVNTPGLHLSIYQNGSQIYEELANAEENPELKRIYQDSSLLIYDLRLSYCGGKVNVLNRKTFSAYQFFKTENDRLEYLYNLFNDTFEQNGNDIWDNLLVAYMDVARRYKLVNKDLPNEEVLSIYNKIVAIIDYNISKGAEVEKNEKYKETAFQVLLQIIPLDCQFIDENLVPDLEENPNDLELSKKVVQLSVIAKCTDTGFFIEAATKVQMAEPSYGIAMAIAAYCIKNDDFACTRKYYNEAIGLTDEVEKKGDLYYKLANLSYREDNYPKAREFALKAVETDPSKKEAYSFIGKLYADSYERCKGEVDKVKDRLVFIAAYNMFEKAGDAEAMRQASEQFPSKEELFERNYNAGQSMKLGCWINETVVLQTRD